MVWARMPSVAKAPRCPCTQPSGDVNLIGYDIRRKTPVPLRIACRRVIWIMQGYLAHKKEPTSSGPP